MAITLEIKLVCNSPLTASGETVQIPGRYQVKDVGKPTFKNPLVKL